MKDIFNISDFNIIQDEQNYYFFRALNMADNADVENGRTSVKGKVVKIRSDRQRFEEKSDNNRPPKYNANSPLTLQQMNDHIKMHYSKETNCISLTSNANVAIVYGRGSYKDKYVMLKVPKTELENRQIYNAGKYMLEEIEKHIQSALNDIDSQSHQDTLNIINNIQHCTSMEELEKMVLEQYSVNTINEKNYRGRKLNHDIAIPLRTRLSNYKSLNKEQTLEKNKMIATLTILERAKLIEPIIKHSKNNSRLLQTLGNAFSSSELIHYGEINENEITEIPAQTMDLFSLLQQAKEKNIQYVDEIQQQLLQNLDKVNVLANQESSNTAQSDNDAENTLYQPTIEEMYELTNGKVEYEIASSVINKVYYLSKSKEKTRELSKILYKAVGSNPKYEQTIQEIAKQTFEIEPKTITRINTKGYKLSESVSLDLRQHELGLIDDINKLSDEEIIEILAQRGAKNINEIISKNFSRLSSE